MRKFYILYSEDGEESNKRVRMTACALCRATCDFFHQISASSMKVSFKSSSEELGDQSNFCIKHFSSMFLFGLLTMLTVFTVKVKIFKIVNT
jgi:hypothetical protein